MHLAGPHGCIHACRAVLHAGICPHLDWGRMTAQISLHLPDTCSLQVKDLAMLPQLDGSSPTSTLTPPGDSPPYPFGTPSYPAYRLARRSSSDQSSSDQPLDPKLRAHSADLAPVPSGPHIRPLQHPQSQPAEHVPSPRPGCASLAPAQSRQGFKIEAVGGSRHGSPATARPVGFLWQGNREGPKGSVRGGMQVGAVDVAPRLQRHSWQQPPMRIVKMSGPQRVH